MIINGKYLLQAMVPGASLESPCYACWATQAEQLHVAHVGDDTRPAAETWNTCAEFTQILNSLQDPGAGLNVEQLEVALMCTSSCSCQPGK